MLVVVDGEVAYGVGALLGDLTVAGGGAGVADGGTDPGQQLGGAEGLGDIVVRPEIEPCEHIVLRIFGREEDDRGIGRLLILSQDTCHLETGDFSHHDIQQ